jgi:hypothetical protein
LSELKQSLRLAPIDRASAERIIRQHPLGIGSRSYSFAVGVFWQTELAGALIWGAPVVNYAVYAYRLYQREALELRKFWLANELPRNSESRCLAICVRLIAKQYPHLRLLLTYCDSEEAASAYRASGWIPQKANRYLREVELPNGAVLSLRDVNRKGGRRCLPEGWKGRFVSRRKWVYVLDESLKAAVVQIASTLTHQVREDGAKPIRSLQDQQRSQTALAGPASESDR